MKEANETTYEQPAVEDFGTLVELTLGNKKSHTADQLSGVIPSAFSEPSAG